MKNMVAGVWICLLAGMGVAAQNDSYRTFTDAQGRALEARIASFDDRTGKVELKRQDGKTFRVAPNLFSEADQIYIREWVAADQALSDKNLRISFTKKSKPVDEKATVKKAGFNGEAVHFEVTVNNLSAQPILNMEVQYRYYVSVDYKSQQREDHTRLVSGRSLLAKIPASSSVTFTTDSVTFGEEIKLDPVIDSHVGVQGYEEKTVFDEDLEGIWLRLHGPKVAGESVFRDVCYPDRLQKKVNWDDDE